MSCNAFRSMQTIATSSFGTGSQPFEWLQGDSSTVISPTVQHAQHAQHEVPSRNVYSFCMCPGGQVVPTIVDEGELCVNGMSFSRRDSRWANSAVVVAVGERDWQPWVVRQSSSVSSLIHALQCPQSRCRIVLLQSCHVL
jgi:hypothetical protein